MAAYGHEMYFFTEIDVEISISRQKKPRNDIEIMSFRGYLRCYFAQLIAFANKRNEEIFIAVLN